MTCAEVAGPHPDARVATWRAGATDAEGDSVDVPGALGGSRLFDQPQHRAELRRFEAFIAAPGPIAMEVGFDHGHRLRSLAAADPAVRWIGLEVRRARVEALAERAPPTLLPWRADARVVVRRFVPPGRLSRLDVLFPTPWWHAGRRAKRQLFTAAFVADAARALTAEGLLVVETDVGPYFDHVAALLSDWRPTPPPPPAPIPSRRQARCAREGITVWSGAWRPPG